MSELTNKQRVFVEEYLRCWNGTEAARRAEYSASSDNVLAATASRLLRNVKVREHIKARIEEKAMSADEVLAHLADIARFDSGSMLGLAGVVDFDAAKERGDTRFIKKMEWGDGKLKLEFYDRTEALELIGKHQAMWIERQEHSGAIDVSITSPRDEISRRLSGIAAREREGSDS